jgi:hypothetical protein
MSRAVKAAKCRPPKSWRGEFVYKYGRIDTPERLGWLERIITRHELYIPKPEELNDPKEARPKIASASIGEFINTLQKYFIKSQPAMTQAEEQYHRKVIDFNLRKYGTNFVIGSFEDGLTRQFETQRIYSVSKRPNNLHLWKKYARGIQVTVSNFVVTACSKATSKKSDIVTITRPTSLDRHNCSAHSYSKTKTANSK